MDNLINWYKNKGIDHPQNGVELLREELGIRVKEYPDVGLYVYNYDQIESPKTDPVVMECRGLILDTHFNPVCRPLDRFFNMGEALNITENFDITQSIVYEKVDGSLCKLYKYDGLWRVGTRGTAFAGTENYTGRTFKDMIHEALGVVSTYHLTEVMDGFNDELTFIMEFVSPDNRIVTPYEKSEMVLLAVRHNVSGREVNDDYCQCVELFQGAGLNVRLPKTYHFSSNEQMKEFVNQLDGLQEGVVIHDLKNNIRVKVKSELYVAVHKVRGENILTPKSIRELVVTGEVDEYLVYFPEDVDKINPYQEKWDVFVKSAVETFEKYKGIEDQKEFAMSIKDFMYKDALFKARRNGISVVQSISEMRKSHRIGMLAQLMENE